MNSMCGRESRIKTTFDSIDIATSLTEGNLEGNVENTMKDPAETSNQDQTPQHSQRQSWHVRMFPGTLDRLREHSKFALQDDVEGKTAGPEVLLVHAVSEADREPIFHLELLRIFRQRLHFLAGLALLMLPLSALIRAYIAHEIWLQVVLSHAFMFLACIMVQFLSRHLTTILSARMLSLLAYVMFSIGAVVAAGVTLEAAIADGGVLRGGDHLIIYAGYNLMVLSVLLLPYSVWESLVVSVILIGPLAWLFWWVLWFTDRSSLYLHLFTLGSTALIVLCIAHFQNLLRRRAFDTAFDLARSAAQLQELSSTDAVTGGFNRRHLERMLNIEIARAVRFQRPLSVMMFDLDNFKYVNDTHGHTAGDEVLREVYQVALSVVREIDTVARYGGDEFVVILPETDQAAAHVIAERLRTAVPAHLQARFNAVSVEGQVTLSVGLITLHPSEPISLESVIEHVDIRLYEAKRRGKDRIAV